MLKCHVVRETRCKKLSFANMEGFLRTLAIGFVIFKSFKMFIITSPPPFLKS